MSGHFSYGASPDPASLPCSLASGPLGLRPRRGGTGRGDEGGINDRALPHRHAPLTEVGLDSFKNLLSQAMLLQQMAEGQDRRFIRNPVADQLNASKAAHGGHLDQGFFHRRVAE